MVRTIVVDDEWYNLQEVCGLAEKTGFLEVVKQYQNPLQVLEDLETTCPQAAFIDIEMPEMDGITLAETLLQKSPSIMIVFITSWNQYAVQAFELNAIDYIMKPIRAERFERMVEKIRQNMPIKPVISPELKIQCFGGFEVSLAGVPVKWERAKAEELFAYLLINHNRYVHKERIIETLWPNYEPKKALPVLQTAICKIRSLFAAIKSAITIDYSGNSYALLINNADCDFLKIEDTLKNYKLESQETQAKFETVCEFYSKGLLSQQGYLWSIEKEQELKTVIVEKLREISKNYLRQSDNKCAVRVLRLLARLTPEDDNVNYSLMNLLKRLGDNAGMRKHYEWLENVLHDEYDSKPSERIKSIAIAHSRH